MDELNGSDAQRLDSLLHELRQAVHEALERDNHIDVLLGEIALVSKASVLVQVDCAFVEAEVISPTTTAFADVQAAEPTNEDYSEASDEGFFAELGIVPFSFPPNDPRTSH